MKLAVCFTNFGPYHLARLRALGRALERLGGQLLAYEVAGQERKYPWSALSTEREPFQWSRFFPDREVETIARGDCASAMRQALDRDQPDAVAIVGYVRPESLAALRWSTTNGSPLILMSESQEIDHPRVWWKEAIKRRRLRHVQAALVGGPSHRAYLLKLGIPNGRIVLGYNAVDNAFYHNAAERARRDPTSRDGKPRRPYFLTVNRFEPEKNLLGLLQAYAAYREQIAESEAWDLVLCGDGRQRPELFQSIEQLHLQPFVHLPGFLQMEELASWYALAGAFVHPSLMEPWGLVVNEAAACRAPLLVSERAGCAETLVPHQHETAGMRFDPTSLTAIRDALLTMSRLSPAERAALGERAEEIVAAWGPDRFAQGTLQAVDLAFERMATSRGSRPRPLPRTRRRASFQLSS